LPTRSRVRVEDFRLPARWTRMFASIETPTTVGAFLADVASRSADELELGYRVIFLAISCELLVYEP